MQPESSDGFASVGTILPEEGAALLPGGSFRFCGVNRFPVRRGTARSGCHFAGALYVQEAQRYNRMSKPK